MREKITKCVVCGAVNHDGYIDHEWVPVVVDRFPVISDRSSLADERDDQKARADKAEAEVERLRAERDTLDICGNAAAISCARAEARIAGLLQIIRDAPHEPKCSTHAAFQPANGFPCTCWKSRALEEGK